MLALTECETPERVLMLAAGRLRTGWTIPGLQAAVLAAALVVLGCTPPSCEGI